MRFSIIDSTIFAMHGSSEIGLHSPLLGFGRGIIFASLRVVGKLWSDSEVLIVCSSVVVWGVSIPGYRNTSRKSV